MTTKEQTATEPVEQWAVTPYRFSVSDYHRLGDLGIFPEDSRVELIDGEVLVMPPIGGAHMWGVNRLVGLFRQVSPDLAILSPQNPVRLAEHQEPVPDFALLRPSATSKRDVPGPADVFLIIEVSDTTLRFDRDTKIPRYAAAGIPDVWILDIPGDCLRVYREPKGGEYRSVTVLGRGETISPLAFPDLVIKVDDLLG